MSTTQRWRTLRYSGVGAAASSLEELGECVGWGGVVGVSLKSYLLERGGGVRCRGVVQ